MKQLFEFKHVHGDDKATEVSMSRLSDENNDLEHPDHTVRLSSLDNNGTYRAPNLDEVEDVEQKGRKDMENKIREAYTARVPAGMKFQVEIRVGLEHQRILEFAEEQKVDLLIIGRQGRIAAQFF